MKNPIKITIGVLSLIILVGLMATITFKDVRIDVEKTKSIFYINQNGTWIVSGVEYNSLYNGTKSISRGETVVNTYYNESEVKIVRTANYKNSIIRDTYYFKGNINDVMLFPIYHTIEIINGSGLIYQYKVDNLEYTGKNQVNLISPVSFGKRMKIEWDMKNYYSSVTNKNNKGTFILKYKVNSDYEIFNARLFDPILVSSFSEKDVLKVNEFFKSDFNKNYGVIRVIIDDYNTTIAEYSLTKHTEQCLIDCASEGKTILYEKMSLFDSLRFYSKLDNLINLDYYEIYINDTEEYFEEEPIYSTVCQDKIINGTKMNICEQVSKGTQKIIKTKEVWKKYNNELLPAGNYKWKIVAKKKPLDSIDLVPISMSKELNEWAWWNSSWTRKKAINISENSGKNLTNYSVLLNIAYDSDMQSDFDDLRFVNSNEDTELGYWIDNKSDGNYAYVWVKIPTLTANSNTTIYMYYGNNLATSNSNGKNAFLIYDDFNAGSLNTTLWETWYTGANDLSIGFVSGQIEINKTDFFSNGGIKSKPEFNFTSPFFIRAKMYPIRQGIRTVASESGATVYIDNAGIHSEIWDSQRTITQWGNSAYNRTFYYDIANISFNSMYINYYYNYGTTSKLVLNQTLTHTVTNQTNPGNQTFDLRVYTVRWYTEGGVGQNRWDEILLGKYTYPEPTYIFGQEQEQFPPFPSPLNITLYKPENNTLSGESLQEFICNISSVNEISNLTLYIWNSTNLIYTNTTNLTGTSNQSSWLFNFSNYIFNDGNSYNFEWNCYGCDIGLCNWSDENFTISIDPYSPVWNYINPTPANGTILNSSNFTITINTTVAHKKNVTFNLYNMTNLLNSTTITHTSNQESIVFTGLKNATYYYFNVTVCDQLDRCNSTDYLDPINSTRTIFVNREYKYTQPLVNLSCGISLFKFNVTNSSGVFEPIGQNSSCGILNVTNNFTSSLIIFMSINETHPCIVDYANYYRNFADSIMLVPTENRTIISTLNPGESAMIWMWTKYSCAVTKTWRPRISVIGGY